MPDANGYVTAEDLARKFDMEYAYLDNPTDTHDYASELRMWQLQEQLKVVHQNKLPLCGDCLFFHNKKVITCHQVQEMKWTDCQLMGNAF